MSYAYELLPKLKHLALCGYDKEEGEYEFIGTYSQWQDAERLEEVLSGIRDES